MSTASRPTRAPRRSPISSEETHSKQRGIDGLWGMYQWLDRAPLGRNENGFWWRRHDEYASH